MRIRKKILALCLSGFIVSQANAQFQGDVYKQDSSANVVAGSLSKTLAWTGGFNNPQFAMADLNNDGRQDLVVYERSSYQLKTFLNMSTTSVPDYRYAPSYAANFPIVQQFMKMEDYNCDNIPDLFFSQQATIAVYRGYYNNNQLCFTKYKSIFYSPLANNAEGFEPANFPPNQWRKHNVGWIRQSGPSTNPAASAQSGSAMALFTSASLPSGSTALLITKRFRLSYIGLHAKLSFWMYRDGANPTAGDSLSIYVNSDTSLANAIYINRVARCRTINQPDMQSANGWYHYTFDIPQPQNKDTAYLIFKGTSQGGGNIYLDNITWISSNPFGDVNVYVEPSDVPGMVDIDNDGDLDFFAFYIGGGFITYYKNYQVEEGLPCDTIRVNVKDNCWGKVAQGFNREQALGITCFQPDPEPNKTTLHTGNTLCMLDYDGDGDYDYLNGGISFSDIQYLQNGKANYAWPRDTIINQDTSWDSNGSHLVLPTQPAAYWLDIDQDGAKDLLFAPNAENVSENYKCIHFYKNTGSQSSPSFVYQSDSFLVDKTIDLGTGAYPVIYDYNKDGKPDLLIGSDGFFQNNSLRSKISYYKNNSTAGNVSFSLESNDLLGLNALNQRGASLAIGDLDNDGRDDLVMGRQDGSLRFYKNMAPFATQQPDWQMTIAVLKDANNVDIDSGQFAAPVIYDIDKDGKKDLIIGSQTGYLYYYRNTGTNGVVKLEYKTSHLGMAKADPFNLFAGYSAPYIGKMDNTNVDYLLLGSNSGIISRYSGFQTGNVTNPFTRIDSVYSNINARYTEGDLKYAGMRSTPAVGDLDGDGKYELVVGNVLGGVFLYRQVLEVNAVPEIAGTGKNCFVYPNPAGNEVYVSWNGAFASEGTVTVSILSITGQVLKTEVRPAGNAGLSISTREYASGMYMCVVQAGGKRESVKLGIIH
jgi:hypothetical protein